MTVRLIILRDKTGNNESVIFLDQDDDTSATDFCSPGWKVVYDEEIDADLPSEFPLGYELNRRD